MPPFSVWANLFGANRPKFSGPMRPRDLCRRRAPSVEPLEQRVLLSVQSVLDTNTFARLDVAATQTAEQVSVSVSPGAALASEADAVVVTPTQIITEHDTVPRFAAQPTISSVKSGQWNDPAVWSANRLPGAGDRVMIAAGMSVKYTIVSDASIQAVEVAGALTFGTNVNTRLKTGVLTVLPAGTLQIGTATAPIAAGVKSELVIANRPLDLTLDPKQYGNGLLAFGTVTMYGAPKSQDWVRLAAEPRAGDTSILLSVPVTGWKVGSRIFLPDTRQVPTTAEFAFRSDQFAPQWEEATISKVQGSRIFLTAPLAYDHLGARNYAGALELLPHVALLDRNIEIRSENPAGTRGHTFFSGQATINIQYVEFLDLGRTDALRPLDNTTTDGQGNATHIGTNQVGRYAVHLHHLQGPENLTNTGYQYTFNGNAIVHSKKWGMAIHDTHWGLISDNVVYDAQGAGIVTEDGSEIGNELLRNFTARMQGTHEDGKAGTAQGDYGRGGSGFWFRRSGNILRDNVSTDNTYASFVFDGYNTDQVILPTARGISSHDSGIQAVNNPPGEFSNNEGYGRSEHGLWAAYIAGPNEVTNHPTIVLKNLRLWNTGLFVGVVAYHTTNLVFDGLVMLGDPVAQNRNDVGTLAMDLRTYENYGLTMQNSRIENFRIGINAPANDRSTAGTEQPTTVQNTVLSNYINVRVVPADDGRPSVGNSLTLRNVRFNALTRVPTGTLEKTGPAFNIQMEGRAAGQNLVQPSKVYVYDYNQFPGVNFQVFYREQAASYVLPTTSQYALYDFLYGEGPGVVGSPAAGLTNQQAWAQFGIAYAGAVAPAPEATQRPEIDGITAPVQGSVAATSVTFVTPWNGLTLSDNRLVARYQPNGALPAGARVVVTLDDATEVSDPYALGRATLTDLGVGSHSLKAYLADAGGNQLPGTTMSVVTFAVGAIAPPAIVSAAADAPRQITTKWSAVNGATRYIVERSTDANGWTSVANVDGTTLAFSDTQLNVGTRYYYQVRAANGIAQSSPSSVVSAVAKSASAFPTAPSNFNAKLVNTEVVQLTWNDRSSNESGFVIERAVDPESWIRIATLPANSTSYLDRSIDSGQQYLYRIRAFNATGSSSWVSTTINTASATSSTSASSGFTAQASSAESLGYLSDEEEGAAVTTNEQPASPSPLRYSLLVDTAIEEGEQTDFWLELLRS